MRSIVFASLVGSVVLSACAAPTDDDPSATESSPLRIRDDYDPPPPKLSPPPPPPPIDRYAEAISRYNGYDYDGDGVREIESLSNLAWSSTTPPNTGAPKGMVVIFVDPRVLAGSSQYSPAYVQLMLDLWAGDLRNEGFDPRIVRTQVRRNPNYPDGPTVLSMRRFLRDLRSHFNLSGAILVGDFPEAKILRSTLVRGEIRGDGTTIGGTFVNNVDTLHLNAELVALRTDLVLSDLDGNWESIYRPTMTYRNVTLVPDNVAVSDPSWPQAYAGYYGSRFSSTYQSFKDVFFVRDETAAAYDIFGMFISVEAGNEPGPELTVNDRALTNPIARPEIHVSRINARHVGRKPVSSAAISLLDANGVPRAVPASYTELNERWVDDTNTEIRVLMDYFQRNRAFRHGSDNALPFRTAVIRSPDVRLADPTEYNTRLRTAHPSLANTAPVIADRQSLIGYLDWLEQPAVLRGIVSHASSMTSLFSDDSVPAATSEEVLAKAGTPWHWERQGAELVPSWGVMSSGRMELYRALWENGKLAGKGQRFYVHNGCEVNSPANGSTMSYTSSSYAEGQNAESQLFFTNGLAVLSRAKVFFDKPDRMGDSIAQKGFFGAALHGYFADDAAESGLAPLPWTATGMQRRGRTLDRKKTYFWSVIGDYTLRMKY